MDVVGWSAFETERPDLAEHVRTRLTGSLCYFATTRPDGFPRVHPVGVHVREGRLLVPMTPSSPKGHDLRRSGRYAVHCTVEDTQGGGGEVSVTGMADEVDAPGDFVARGWVAFELRVGEVLSVRHVQNEDRPVVERWRPGG